MDRDPIDPDRLVERRARRRVDMKLGFFIRFCRNSGMRLSESG